MPYPLHQPISLSTGQKIGVPCPRDGAYLDEARDRADILIVDDRGAFDPATQVAVDSEAAEPWPFNLATTRWKRKRAVRAKTAQELSQGREAERRLRIERLSSQDLLTILLAIVNVERQNRAVPAPLLTREQFISYCREELGII